MDNDVTVRDVITGEFVGVSESDSVRGAVQLMREDQASSVIVLRGDQPRGIVTEWDVLGLVADDADPGETPVSEVMSSPVESVDADTPLIDAAGIMSGQNFRNLLVEEEATGEILGVLTDRDLIAVVASLQKTPPGAVAAPGESEVGGPAGTATDAANPPRDRREATGATSAGGPNGNGQPDAYASQGVCETCGSFADDLREINGQLVCADCQEM